LRSKCRFICAHRRVSVVMEAVACTPRRVASPTPSLQPRAMSVGCKLPWRCSSGGHANGTLRSGYSSPRRAARGNCLEPAPPPARQRWRVGALAGSSSLSISSVDEAAWEKAYGRSALPLGISLEQGARETMEDAVQVVPHGRHGFLFASESPEGRLRSLGGVHAAEGLWHMGWQWC
jgi:hypothetical protein